MLDQVTLDRVLPTRMKYVAILLCQKVLCEIEWPAFKLLRRNIDSLIHITERRILSQYRKMGDQVTNIHSCSRSHNYIDENISDALTTNELNNVLQRFNWSGDVTVLTASSQLSVW